MLCLYGFPGVGCGLLIRRILCFLLFLFDRVVTLWWLHTAYGPLGCTVRSCALMKRLLSLRRVLVLGEPFGSLYVAADGRC